MFSKELESCRHRIGGGLMPGNEEDEELVNEVMVWQPIRMSDQCFDNIDLGIVRFGISTLSNNLPLLLDKLFHQSLQRLQTILIVVLHEHHLQSRLPDPLINS